MTLEGVLMYFILVTAVLLHTDLSTITASFILAGLGGSLLIINSFNSTESHRKQVPSIWEGVIRTLPNDLVSNSVVSLLVPLAVVLSTITKTKYEGPSDYATFLHTLALAEALVAALLIWLQINSDHVSEKSRHEQQQTAAWRSFTHTLPVAVAFVTINNYVFELGLASAMIQGITVLIQCFVQAYLPLWCPRSFTFGEVAILSQAAAQYFGCMQYSILQKYYVLFGDLATSYSVCDTNYYMEIALLCCILVVLFVFALPWCRTVFGFYIMFTLVMGLVAIPALHLLLNENFVQWTINYVTESTWKKRLFIYWLECCLVGLLIVLSGSGLINDFLQSTLAFIKSRIHFKQSSAKEEVSYPTKAGTMTTKPAKSKTMRRASTRIRKLFHLLAVAIFVPGAMKEPLMTCVAGTCCLVIFITMETMRLAQIPPLYMPLQRTFTLFIDEKDQGAVIFTHMYLLVGCVLPMWLYPVQSAPKSIALYAGIISLGVGDTAAAVVGSLIGRHFWKGTHRTKEGTLACIISQLLFIFFLHSLGVFVTPPSWDVVVLAVILTSLAEAYTSHIDNLILPLVMYSLLL